MIGVPNSQVHLRRAPPKTTPQQDTAGGAPVEVEETVRKSVVALPADGGTRTLTSS